MLQVCVLVHVEARAAAFRLHLGFLICLWRWNNGLTADYRSAQTFHSRLDEGGDGRAGWRKVAVIVSGLNVQTCVIWVVSAGNAASHSPSADLIPVCFFSCNFACIFCQRRIKRLGSNYHLCRDRRGAGIPVIGFLSVPSVCVQVWEAARRTQHSCT